MPQLSDSHPRQFTRLSESTIMVWDGNLWFKSTMIGCALLLYTAYFLPSTITDVEIWIRSHFFKFFIFLYARAKDILHSLLMSRADFGESVRDSSIFLECLSPRILNTASTVGSSSIIFPLSISFISIANHTSN